MIRDFQTVTLVLAAVGMLSACNTAPPNFDIVDRTEQHWLSGKHVFVAELSDTEGWEIDQVRVRYRRHYWPTGFAGVIGAVATNDWPAERDGTTNRYLAAPPDLAGAPDGDHLYYYWEVDYRQAGSDQEIETRTHPLSKREFIIGCTPQMIDQQLLNAQQALLALFNTPNPHKGLQGPSFAPHYYTSIEGIGVGFSPPAVSAIGEAKVMPTSLQPLVPALLFYAPRPRIPADTPNGETDTEYLAKVSEPSAPDSPYQLVGWAYGGFYDTASRPSVGCLPSSEWFVHEAGFHTPDGGMVVYQVDESVPGAELGPGFAPPLDAPNVAITSWWHPRIWDMRVWIKGAGQVPEIAMYHPGGLNPSKYPGGVVPGINPDGLFFPAETYE